MIFDEIIKNKISKIKKITLLNNFPEDLQNSIISSIVGTLRENYRDKIEFHRIYDDINVKKLTEYINNFGLFSQTIAIFIYNFSSNLSSLKKLVFPSDLYLFIFTDEKNLSEDTDTSIIQFPKNLTSSEFIKDFFVKNNIKFENNSVEELFNSYFNNISSSLEKVLEDILIYLNKIKSNIVTKEISIKFLSFSSNFTIFNITNSFFQKDKYSFFYQYIQFIESENDFNSFLQPFLKEVKILTILSSIISEKSYLSNFDKNNILSFFNKINFQYNPYRLQYDLKKIENFGKKKFLSLLEFLLSIDIYNRYYDKSSAQKLFEIGINQFI
ncbi:MAG: hypothetical protein NUV32_04985 [Exilispira sp.]|jgi:hypothetical protein|nr:hypothetical protein [Exilispira sp.]